MKTSETIGKIALALLAAQRGITFAVKDSTNPHFKSKYADLGSVIDACKPALNEAGIAFMQMPAPSDPGTIALTTRLIHESGEWIESTATCPLPKNDPQGYGSANTYLRRYALAAAVGLYQDDDDGNAATKGVQSVRHAVRDGIGDDLPDEDKEFLKELAAWCMSHMANPLKVAQHIASQNLDSEQRTYLENQMDSKTRSAIKKAEAEIRAAFNSKEKAPA
jgi:hypothetical protein